MTLVAWVALLLPGLAGWAWLGRRGRDPLEALAQIIGLSMAAIILVAEFGFLLGIRFSTAWIILLLLASVGAAVFGLVRRPIRFTWRTTYQLLIGLGVLGLVIAWRLYQARDLLLPNWVDSQHHFLIIRAMLEQRGLPDTLEPYLAQPFYYHYGFHVVAALFNAVSGLEIGQAMLGFGQVLNALVGLSIFTLGKALWGNWRPAAAAALLVSFVTRMPAYYLTWGRYTLLIGLVLLPLAMAVALRMLREPGRRTDVITLALLTAGTLLSHYFAALLLALFLLVLAGVHFAPRLRRLLTASVPFWGIAAGVGLGLLAALPWLLRVARFNQVIPTVQSNLPASLATLVTPPESATESASYLWKLLGPASNYGLQVVAVAGLGFSLIRKRSVALGLWSILLAILTIPWTASLRPFRPDHFAIVLFLPVALWAGWAFWQAGARVAVRLQHRWAAVAVIAVLVSGWTIWALPLSRNMINSRTVLVNAEDMAALAWVRENAPEDARFFINTTYWQNNVYRGVDGGGWLLPYTGRWSLVPTVFYGFSPDGATNQQLRSWGEAASTISTCNDAFWALVDAAELDWVYVREGAGALQTEGLAGCEGVAEVYQQDGVSLWRVER